MSQEHERRQAVTEVMKVSVQAPVSSRHSCVSVLHEREHCETKPKVVYINKCFSINNAVQY